MSDKVTVSAPGVGFGGLLFLLFLALKLTNVVDWSWWWVTAPLWIPAGVVLVFLISAFVVLYHEENHRWR